MSGEQGKQHVLASYFRRFRRTRITTVPVRTAAVRIQIHKKLGRGWFASVVSSEPLSVLPSSEPAWVEVCWEIAGLALAPVGCPLDTCVVGVTAGMVFEPPVAGPAVGVIATPVVSPGTAAVVGVMTPPGSVVGAGEVVTPGSVNAGDVVANVVLAGIFVVLKEVVGLTSGVGVADGRGSGVGTGEGETTAEAINDRILPYPTPPLFMA